MTMSQINCFLAVAKCQSFSKAASRLFISQPAVSKQVSQLEKDLKHPLVDRTSKTFRLTPAGELFYEFLQKTQDMYKKTMDEIQQNAQGRSGDLNLGCLDGWSLSNFFPKLRASFVEKFPDIHLRLNGYNHIAILDALVRDEISIAITLNACIPEQAAFSRREITSVRAMLITSAFNPCAQKEHLSLADFKDNPFFVIAPETEGVGSLEQTTRELCMAAGFTPDIVRMPSSAAIQTRLQGGEGARIASEWERVGSPELFRFTPLDHRLSICAAWVGNDQNPAKYILLNELLTMQEP